MHNYIIEFLDWNESGKKKEHRTNQQLNATNAQAAFGMFCRKKRMKVSVIAVYRLVGRKREKIVSLRSKLKERLNSEFSRVFTSNDVDHYIYLFMRRPEMQPYSKREVVEVILEDDNFFNVFADSVNFLINNKPNRI